MIWLLLLRLFSPLVIDRYDLDRPARVVALPHVLREISGLAPWDAHHLVAHNDERSRLYVVRIRDGKIVRTIDVGRAGGLHGDYEDVLRAGRLWYLLRSDGLILEFKVDDTSRVVSARQYRTFQRAGCELESLALDVVGPTLVATCKHERGTGSKDGMLVLRWNPSEPDSLRAAFRVPWNALATSPGEPRFTASGMARTPDGSGWLVIDGHHGRIAQLARDGSVTALGAVPWQLLPQVEGIAFGEDASLYLSSEGGSGAGVLVVFPTRLPRSGNGRA